MPIVKHAEPHRHVALEGEVDVLIAADLRQLLRSVMDGEGFRFIDVDLARVTFIDSTALGVLYGAHCRLRAHGGGLRVLHASPAVAKVLQATGLDKSFAGPQPDAAAEQGVSL